MSSIKKKVIIPIYPVIYLLLHILDNICYFQSV